MARNHRHIYAVNGTPDNELAKNHEHFYVVNLDGGGGGFEIVDSIVNLPTGVEIGTVIGVLETNTFWAYDPSNPSANAQGWYDTLEPLTSGASETSQLDVSSPANESLTGFAGEQSLVNRENKEAIEELQNAGGGGTIVEAPATNTFIFNLNGTQQGGTVFQPLVTNAWERVPGIFEGENVNNTREITELGQVDISGDFKLVGNISEIIDSLSITFLASFREGAWADSSVRLVAYAPNTPDSEVLGSKDNFTSNCTWLGQTNVTGSTGRRSTALTAVKLLTKFENNSGVLIRDGWYLSIQMISSQVSTDWLYNNSRIELSSVDKEVGGIVNQPAILLENEVLSGISIPDNNWVTLVESPKTTFEKGKSFNLETEIEGSVTTQGTYLFRVIRKSSLGVETVLISEKARNYSNVSDTFLSPPRIMRKYILNDDDDGIVEFQMRKNTSSGTGATVYRAQVLVCNKHL